MSDRVILAMQETYEDAENTLAAKEIRDRLGSPLKDVIRSQFLESRRKMLEERVPESVKNALRISLEKSSRKSEELNERSSESTRAAAPNKCQEVDDDDDDDDGVVEKVDDIEGLGLRGHSESVAMSDTDELSLAKLRLCGTSKVFLNDRVIHATGVHGSRVLRMTQKEQSKSKRFTIKKKAFSLFGLGKRKKKDDTQKSEDDSNTTAKGFSDSPSFPPKLQSSVSVGRHIRKGGRVRSMYLKGRDGSKMSIGALVSSRAPYAFWREKCRKAEMSDEDSVIRKILGAVDRVIKKVVHSVHTQPYIPPLAPLGETYASFDLVTPEELSLIVAAATSVLAQNSNALVRVDAPVKVFGDIHGQIFDLVQFFRQYGAPSHHVGDMNLCNYIFAGDFVDRGAYSLEVLTVLLCLKIRYHPHVILLRGNHEDSWANKHYGFSKEIEARLGPLICEQEIEEFQTHVLALYQRLPLAALIGERILCVHGGPGLHVKTLAHIESIKLPFAHPVHYMLPDDDEQRRVVDLLWSDPIDTCGLTKEKDLIYDSKRGWEGRGFNDHRRNGTYFGPDIVREFCRRNGIDLILRAHECVHDGMKLFADGLCVTIFSAPKYCDHDNAGAIAEISRGLQVQFKALTAKDSDSHWSHKTDVDSPRGAGRGGF